MIKLRLDDSPCNLTAEEGHKVGDAITHALSSLPPTRIVTQMKIDGNRYSARAQSEIMNESIESTYDIEIKTADKAIWAATGFDIALSCIEMVQRSIIRSAELFRETDKLNGNRLFVQCIEGLERFIEAITVTKIAINLDFAKANVDGVTLSQLENDLQTVLVSVFSFQEKEDYQGLADKIEYELLTNLSHWGQALKQLRAQQNSNA